MGVLNVFSATDFQVMESNSGEVLQELPFFFSKDFRLPLSKGERPILSCVGETRQTVPMRAKALLDCSCVSCPAEAGFSWSALVFHDPFIF